MNSDRDAHLYAVAIHTLAGENYDEAYRVLSRIADALRVSPELLRILKHPAISFAEKREAISHIVGDGLSPCVGVLIDELLTKRKISILENIVKQLVVIHEEIQGTVSITVESAHKLSEEERRTIVGRLSNICGGKKVAATFSVHPELIGGYRMIIGSVVLDDSIVGELENIRRSFELSYESKSSPNFTVEFSQRMDMSITSSEVTQLLFETLKKHESKIDTREIGYVLQVGDGIARVFGLDRTVYGELVQFPNGISGMVMNLERESVGCILLGEAQSISEGDEVRRTGAVISVPVGDELLGRVVNALGEPIDGKGSIQTKKRRPIEVIAPGVVERQSVKQPLQTGIMAIDSMIPIGRGQRELIIGDRQIGKTAIAIDTIINQKNEPNRPVCIYVAIGQKQSSVAQLVDTLEHFGAMEYTIVVSATASDPAPLQYIAPYSGTAMGEEIMWNGKDVLCVYDDLTRHAQAYRQISLLLRRPPGREAYPGDIFYLHSRLLERACKLSEENGGGSLTALPIIETQAGDISAYIPTNVISITDGQIYLERDAFFAGIRPAVNVGLSVSRVGGSAQIRAMRQVAGRLRIDLAQYAELSSFAQFASELDKRSQAQLSRGQRLIELLKQDQYQPLPVELQIVTLFAGVNGFVDDVDVKSVREWAINLQAYIRDYYPDILSAIREKRQIDDDLKAQIENAITRFKQKQ